MIKQFSTIILDLFGVVIKENRNSFIEYAKEVNPNLDIEKAKLVFENAINGNTSTKEFFELLSIDERFLKDYVINRLSLNEGFIEFAENYSNEYDFVLMTNNLTELNSEILKHFNIEKYFKHIFVSQEMNCAKPKFGIYDGALAIMNKSPQECIFIDNREKNLLAAEEVGMAPILFEDGKERYYGISIFGFKELLNFIG